MDCLPRRLHKGQAIFRCSPISPIQRRISVTEPLRHRKDQNDMSKKLVKAYATLKNSSQRLQEQPPMQFAEDLSQRENELLVIYPEVQYQKILGFGGAVTESVGYVWSKLDAQARDAVLDAYFGSDGIGYTLCRSHIQSCDFSLGNYAYITQEDPSLAGFQMDRDRQFLIPMLQKITTICNGQLRLLCSPWSPPAFMKDTNQMNGGGKLKKQYYGLWSQVIARYIQEYRQMGIPVWGITIQNEAKATQKWESCVMTAQEERELLSNHIKPALHATGLSDVEVYFWDHNKERAFERTVQFMSGKESGSEANGVAVHWYAGDHFDALRMIHERFPELKILSTEACVENFTSTPPWDHAERYAHDIIGGLNNYLSAFLDWNILLDQTGGPTHIQNYCNAPVIVHTDSGRIEFRPSFYYLGHFSKFIRPGAVRIGSSCYTSDLESVAFLNEDNTIVVTILNRNDTAYPVYLKYQGEIVKMDIAEHSIQSIVFPA